ncbi:hypothetical protein Q8F55_008314 [Vanrija albida]|uniref:Ig-like domain-containing protein n=1 Tax=Vanrija albida TaxID=181172 RepID=A0ABR3PWX2_9TREE
MFSKTLIALALVSVAAAAPADAPLAKLTCFGPKDCSGGATFTSTFSVQDKITQYWNDPVTGNGGLGKCVDFAAEQTVTSCKIESLDPAYSCSFGGTWATNCFGTFAAGYTVKNWNGQDQSCATGDRYFGMEGNRIYGGLVSCRRNRA